MKEKDEQDGMRTPMGKKKELKLGQKPRTDTILSLIPGLVLRV